LRENIISGTEVAELLIFPQFLINMQLTTLSFLPKHIHPLHNYKEGNGEQTVIIFIAPQVIPSLGKLSLECINALLRRAGHPEVHATDLT
jgi:hypothetical protein